MAEQLAIRSNDSAATQEAMLARARRYLGHRQPLAVWETLEAAEKAHLVTQPGAEWLAFRGDAALATRRLDDALQAYSRLAERFPNSHEAARRAARLGLLLELEGKPESARRAYSRVGRGLLDANDAPWVDTRLQALLHPYFPPRGNRENERGSK
jgi:tetratricopeptide (TPR) repeat protein